MSLAGRRRLTVPCLLLMVGFLSCACSTTSTQGSPGVRPSREFTNGGECAPLATPDLPRDAGCVTTVRGDVNGDGAGDALTVYARTDEDRLPRSWRMRVQSGSRVIDQSLDAGTEFSYPRAVGAADVNGDERDEWFVKTLDLSGHGTAWLQLSLFTLQGGRISIVEYEDQALALRVGGVSRTGEGVGCGDGRLLLLRAEADNVRNTRWDTSTRAFALEGSLARLVDKSSDTLEVEDYNDPVLDAFYSLECAGLRYTP